MMSESCSNAMFLRCIFSQIENGRFSRPDTQASTPCSAKVRFSRSAMRSTSLPPSLRSCSRREMIEARASPLSSAKARSEEHTSELQSLMRISYADFCLKKKKQQTNIKNTLQTRDMLTNKACNDVQTKRSCDY